MSKSSIEDIGVDVRLATNTIPASFSRMGSFGAYRHRLAKKNSERQRSVHFPWLRGDRIPRLYIFPYTIRTARFGIEEVGPFSRTWPEESVGRRTKMILL